jgi:hypothetical protein
MLFPILPPTFIHFAIFKDVFAVPFLPSHIVLPIVRSPVFPYIFPFQMRFPFPPISFISILICLQSPSSMKQSIQPFAIICFAILPNHSAASVFDIALEEPRILIQTLPYFHPIATLLAILKWAFVSIFAISWVITAAAMA